ncbi:hypothetical protein RRG08_015048 [Elysia crispata]|uniref:Uncharacterized protein n=1 Tax=Elysia crispata TaxID=231223 RepID=A0AAE1B737_9GAST|nr:hypothetical protein RRG08_015048 [Elysia crispata]
MGEGGLGTRWNFGSPEDGCAFLYASERVCRDLGGDKRVGALDGIDSVGAFSNTVRGDLEQCTLLDLDILFHTDPIDFRSSGPNYALGKLVGLMRTEDVMGDHRGYRGRKACGAREVGRSRHSMIRMG